MPCVTVSGQALAASVLLTVSLLPPGRCTGISLAGRAGPSASPPGAGAGRSTSGRRSGSHGKAAGKNDRGLRASVLQ